jgi:uncharacterized protein YegP (UPF0339 family)
MRRSVMKDSREMLEAHLGKYEAQLRGLNSYITELNNKAVEHGTDRELFEIDLVEAEHNVKFYESELTRIKGLLEEVSDDATYLVYQDASEEWRWQLRAGNSRIIADSGEGYHNKQDCLHAIALVKGSQDAPVKEKP